jgi:ATP-dependent DNA helicase PIF1
MVEADLFDKLSQVGSIVRKKPEPFGGIQASCPAYRALLELTQFQVIITGDFFQLPPVTRAGQVKFAFEAEFWNKTVQHTFKLTKVFRQRDQGMPFIFLSQ